MHSLSDKVLLRYYESQFPLSETGNLGGWVALGLEFLNLGVDTSKHVPWKRKVSPEGSLLPNSW